MRRPPISPGDVFEIFLSNGYKTYGQFMLMDKYGPIVRVFDAKTAHDDHKDLKVIATSEVLFYAYTGLYAAIRTGLWKKIGAFKDYEFEFPGFISTLEDPETGEAGVWYLWDGEKTTRLGKELPERYKHIEFLAIYPPDLIVKRIETGKKPYEELIKTNKLSKPN